MRKFLIPVALLAAVATACSTGSLASLTGAQASTQPPLPSSSEPVAAVVARTLPAVVNVTTDMFQNTAQGAQQGVGVGTGFIVRSDGVIVTNCHVVEGATKITVSTSDNKPKQFAARVIGGDCQHDLAVLKVNATGLPTVPMGDSSNLLLGQTVVAIGYALALEGGPTVTAGIVSSLNRTIQVQDPNCTVCTNGARTYTDVIQTDAAINHGNSGGPLLNMQGQVIGINSAGDDQAQNIGFAIPINEAKATVALAEKTPLAPSAYLGVTTQTVNAAMALQAGLPVNQGAYVVSTLADGPAAAAGIKRGDVVVTLNGQPINSSDDLGTALAALQPNQKASVGVVHQDGSHQTIVVTLGTRPLPTKLP
jgi:serine protease Do